MIERRTWDGEQLLRCHKALAASVERPEAPVESLHLLLIDCRRVLALAQIAMRMVDCGKARVVRNMSRSVPEAAYPTVATRGIHVATIACPYGKA